MNRKPRKLTDHVIDRDMWIDIAFIGIIMAVVTLIGMDMHLAGGLFTDRSVDALGHEAQLTEARTMASRSSCSPSCSTRSPRVRRVSPRSSACSRTSGCGVRSACPSCCSCW